MGADKSELCFKSSKIHGSDVGGRIGWPEQELLLEIHLVCDHGGELWVSHLLGIESKVIVLDAFGDKIEDVEKERILTKCESHGALVIAELMKKVIDSDGEA